MTAGGGRAALGILMLEGKMADVPGCMASDATFPYPVMRRTVAGSRPPAGRRDAEAMLPLYVAAARELAAAGAAVITDNCNGAMVWLQDRLAAAVQVPVITSALLLVPLVHRLLPARRIGILTFDEAAVDDEICRACGFDRGELPLAVGGVAGCASWQEFLRRKQIRRPLRPRLLADLVAAGRALVRSHPDVGAFVVECTLLPPASQELRDALGLPVFDVLTCLDLAMAGRSRPAEARG
jgi:Asp/Glu/Hydantoin racemase